MALKRHVKKILYVFKAQKFCEIRCENDFNRS